MIGIIVVFPKKENAINIRNLLVRNGVMLPEWRQRGHRQCIMRILWMKELSCVVTN